MQDSVRPPAVASTFYPNSKNELNGLVSECMTNCRDHKVPSPKALIVPHAGYIYSGQVAAEAYNTLATHKSKIERVILLGPAHRVACSGIAAPTYTYFATPLGNIPVAQDSLIALCNQYDFVNYDDAPHEHEHSLEVQLPFLQSTLEQFSIIPLIVSSTEDKEVANVIDTLWGDNKTLIIVSTDLSHFHNYSKAQTIDSKTSEHIEAFDYQAIHDGDVCGYFPLRGFLLAAKQRNLKIEHLALCNSGDTAGSRERVVGYGSWALHEA